MESRLQNEREREKPLEVPHTVSVGFPNLGGSDLIFRSRLRHTYESAAKTWGRGRSQEVKLPAHSQNGLSCAFLTRKICLSKNRLFSPLIAVSDFDLQLSVVATAIEVRQW